MCNQQLSVSSTGNADFMDVPLKLQSAPAQSARNEQARFQQESFMQGRRPTFGGQPNQELRLIEERFWGSLLLRKHETARTDATERELF
jgi:hypothetical protein